MMESNLLGYLNLFISLIAIGISGLSLYRSSKSAKMANNIRMGQEELEIRKMLSVARRDFLDIAEKINDGVSDDKGDFLLRRFDAVKEDFANVYDEACMKYLDGKIDKDRFKKSYNVEIRRMVEDPAFKKLYDDISTKFQATVKVYKEWNHSE